MRVSVLIESKVEISGLGVIVRSRSVVTVDPAPTAVVVKSSVET